VQVGGRELNGDALAAAGLLREAVEEPEILLQRDRLTLENRADLLSEARRQASDEILVGLVDKPVLVADAERIGDAHPDRLIRAQHRAGGGVDALGRAGHPAVQVLHRRDPRLDHLEGGVQGVEVGIDVARRNPAGEP
jgi:hypothetical protein